MAKQKDAISNTSDQVAESQQFVDMLKNYIELCKDSKTGAPYRKASTVRVRPSAAQQRFLNSMRVVIQGFVGTGQFPGIEHVRIDRIRYEDIAHLHNCMLSPARKEKPAEAVKIETFDGAGIKTGEFTMTKMTHEQQVHYLERRGFGVNLIQRSIKMPTESEHALELHDHVLTHDELQAAFDEAWSKLPPSNTFEMACEMVTNCVYEAERLKRLGWEAKSDARRKEKEENMSMAHRQAQSRLNREPQANLCRVLSAEELAEKTRPLSASEQLSKARNDYRQSMGVAFANFRDECGFPIDDVSRSTVFDSMVHDGHLFGNEGEFPATWMSYAERKKTDILARSSIQQMSYQAHLDQLAAMQCRGDFTVAHAGIAAMYAGFMVGETRHADSKTLRNIQEKLIKLPVDTPMNVDIACLANTVYAVSMASMVLQHLKDLELKFTQLSTTYVIKAGERPDLPVEYPATIFLSGPTTEPHRTEHTQHADILELFVKGYTEKTYNGRSMDGSGYTEQTGVMAKQERLIAQGVLSAFLATGTGDFKNIKEILFQLLGFLRALNDRVVRQLIDIATPNGSAEIKERAAKTLDPWLSGRSRLHSLRLVFSVDQTELREQSYSRSVCRPSRKVNSYPEFMPNGFLENAKKLLS